MNKTIVFAAVLLLCLATAAGAEKKAKKNSVSFDPVAYSCASFLKMIGSSAKSGEEQAGVAVMWGYGFLSGLEYAKSLEKPSALDDRTLAALVIDYAAICKRNPTLSFFEATTRLSGVTEKPAPPDEPGAPGEPGERGEPAPAAPARPIPDMI